MHISVYTLFKKKIKILFIIVTIISHIFMYKKNIFPLFFTLKQRETEYTIRITEILFVYVILPFRKMLLLSEFVLFVFAFKLNIFYARANF